MRQIIIMSDANGNNFFALPPSDSVMARALAANTAESITVPSGARFVVFSANADFYANYTTTATVPADTTDGTASELNPSIRFVGSGVNGGPAVTTISVISAATCIVTAAFYS